MSIFGWVFVWCVSGVNNVTDALGKRSRWSCPSGTQLSPQDRCLGYPPCSEYYCSVADPLDWFCWHRHVSYVEAEQRWRQFGALRDAGAFTVLKQVCKNVAGGRCDLLILECSL